jgi:hypothetical protein
MTGTKKRMKTTAILAFLFTAPAAAAQPASWADEQREPMCIYDGLVAPAGAAGLDAARVGTIRSECMRRFGWTEAQGNRGFIVARLMLEMMVARREAIGAGVDAAVMDSVFDSFSSEEVASMGNPGTPVSERARLIGGDLARRLVERGLAREAASKAGRAILMRMMATHMIAEFAREVMSSPAG